MTCCLLLSKLVSLAVLLCCRNTFVTRCGLVDRGSAWQGDRPPAAGQTHTAHRQQRARQQLHHCLGTCDRAKRWALLAALVWQGHWLTLCEKSCATLHRRGFLQAR